MLLVNFPIFLSVEFLLIILGEKVFLKFSDFPQMVNPQRWIHLPACKDGVSGLVSQKIPYNNSNIIFKLLNRLTLFLQLFENLIITRKTLIN